MTKDPQPGTGTYRKHTHIYGCHFFSILLIVSLTQGWTGVVHSYSGMTKDPQPGSGNYDPHTSVASMHVRLSFLHNY